MSIQTPTAATMAEPSSPVLQQPASTEPIPIPKLKPSSTLDSDQSSPSDLETQLPATNTTDATTTSSASKTSKSVEFPPDDARSMSPRQSSENLAAMCSESRGKIQDSTLEHQSSLAALIEKIETVRTGHQKLERDNNALQEYIGGLTRSMSKTTLSGGVGGGTVAAGVGSVGKK